MESGARVVVGVNTFTEPEPAPPAPFAHDPRMEDERRTLLAAWRNERDAGACASALARVERAARGSENLVPVILDAVVARATLGEVCDVMRGVFGVYEPGDRL